MLTSKNADRTDVLSLESGLRALQSSSEFRGPVEELDGHESNDHLALIYENQTEQFAAAVPFTRQGLERDERCLYIVDENSKEDVMTALREGGVDVDAALESGALTIHSKQDTYLRDGSFDPDEMIEFLSETIDAAQEEYEALRITGEMTWILGDDPEMDDLIEYEGKLNRLIPDENCIALCQYNRKRFPAEIIRDIVKSHPHLIYDGMVCQNFYYTPPEEFFGPERPDREVDQMMRTLGDRTEARTTLQARERSLRTLYDAMSDPDLSFDEKMTALLEVGRERFGLDIGFFARVDDETFEVVDVVGSHDEIQPGSVATLEDTYCHRLLGSSDPLGVTDAPSQGWKGDPAYEKYELDAYLGTTVTAGKDTYGTLCFASKDSHSGTFTDDEYTFLEFMGQWLSNELERTQREDRLAALNDLTQELMNAETAAEVSDYVIDAASDHLDLTVASVALYDPADGSLEPEASTDHAADLVRATSAFDTGQGIGWQAFAENKRKQTLDPLRKTDEVLHPRVTEVVALPLGTHGVLLAGSTGNGGFGQANLEFVETVAGNVNAALDRANREQQLHERENRLEEQNGSLERLRRINRTIRRIDQALVSASGRAEIVDVVCRELTDAGPYELAWFGKHDPVTGELTPNASAGAKNGYLDAVHIDAGGSTDGGPPSVRAARTGTPQIVNKILEDPPFEPWRRAALSRGFHAVISLPLVHEETLFGVLTLYADQAGVFDDLEWTVLDELSDTIAYAINAVESKKALVSNEVTELKFSLSDTDNGIVELVDETGCEFAYEYAVPQANGRVRGFFTTCGVSPGVVRDYVSSLPVDGLKLLSDRTEDGKQICLFEAELTSESLVDTVLAHGGRINEFQVTDDDAIVSLHVAADAEIREFVSAFKAECPAAEVTAKRTRERPERTQTEFHATLTDELTARQLETIQTAYFSGYFENPRTRTGSEIAASMDITQPTFNNHLRAAQRKLYRQLFEAKSR